MYAPVGPRADDPGLLAQHGPQQGAEQQGALARHHSSQYHRWGGLFISRYLVRCVYLVPAHHAITGHCCTTFTLV